MRIINFPPTKFDIPSPQHGSSTAEAVARTDIGKRLVTALVDETIAKLNRRDRKTGVEHAWYPPRNGSNKLDWNFAADGHFASALTIRGNRVTWQHTEGPTRSVVVRGPVTAMTVVAAVRAVLFKP